MSFPVSSRNLNWKTFKKVFERFEDTFQVIECAIFLKVIPIDFSEKKPKYNSIFFSDYVEDLLHESQEEFHTLMKRTYGILYEENKDIFEKFFSELTKFLIRGKGDLIKSTHSLFSTLALKMFKVRAFGNLFWTKIEFRGKKKKSKVYHFFSFFRWWTARFTFLKNICNVLKNTCHKSNLLVTTRKN